MKKILVKINDYKKYLETGTNRLDKKNKIYTNSQFPNFLNISEKIFEPKENKYNIVKNNEDHILIKFKTKNDNEYRLDLLKEPNSEIYHIAFSLFDRNLDNDYHLKTDLKEPIDVISGLVWILKDLKKDVEYCIGSTGDDIKDNIYQYLMKYVSDWEKRKTKQYDLGWAIYFKI